MGFIEILVSINIKLCYSVQIRPTFVSIKLNLHLFKATYYWAINFLFSETMMGLTTFNFGWKYAYHDLIKIQVRWDNLHYAQRSIKYLNKSISYTVH